MARRLAGYLARIVTAGQHPNLAAALADGPSPPAWPAQEDLFEHAMRRILAGLLPPTTDAPGGQRPCSAPEPGTGIKPVGPTTPTASPVAGAWVGLDHGRQDEKVMATIRPGSARLTAVVSFMPDELVYLQVFLPGPGP